MKSFLAIISVLATIGGAVLLFSNMGASKSQEDYDKKQTRQKIGFGLFAIGLAASFVTVPMALNA